MAATKLSRFQGSLVGAVVGDCIGAVFEGGWFDNVELDRIVKLSTKIDDGNVWTWGEMACFESESKQWLTVSKY